jgi:glycerol-3-phosphate dehydrogenase (NAD+)
MLAREMQELFASPYMRINNTSDVTGVEICGALKNVLAIAAGIVEGLNLGNNAMAALVTQVGIPSAIPHLLPRLNIRLFTHDG